MTTKTCTIDGCTGFVQGRGWCFRHYQRWRRHGDPLHLVLRPARLPCSVPDCAELAKGRGFCGKHYQRWRKRGDPAAPSLRSDLWTPAETEALLDEIRGKDGRPDPDACVRYGALAVFGRATGRTRFTVAKKLWQLRRQLRDGR